MAITLNGTTGITSPGGDTSTSLATTNLSYTGTLTGGTGVIAIGTNQIYKDASGNVGIGVTPSAWNSVYRAFDFGSLGGIASAANTVGIYTNVYVDSAFNSKYKTTNYATSYLQNSNGTGQHQWFIAPSGSAGGTISFTQAMTLDASGNLGLGATSISALGTGYTTMAVQGTNGAGFRLYAGATEYGRVYADATAMVFQSVGVQPQVFYLNGSERVRIDSSGNLWIGATSNPASALLYVNQQGANAAINVVATTAGYSATLIYGQTTRAASTSFDMIGCYANGVAQFRVNGAGTIYATNTVVQSASDIRLKENIKDSLDGLDIITALRPVRFDWKQGYGNDRQNQLGFIAQEVEPVFPDAVDETCRLKDGDDEVYKTVGPGALIPVLVKAIQELTIRLEALEAK